MKKKRICSSFLQTSFYTFVAVEKPAHTNIKSDNQPPMFIFGWLPYLLDCREPFSHYWNDNT